MNTISTLAATSTGGGLAFTAIYIVAIVGIFYFFMIRPQKKQQKAHDAMLTTIAPGDSVLTSSGFYGVIIDVNEDVVIVEFGSNKNCRIPMRKEAIQEVEKPQEN